VGRLRGAGGPAPDSCKLYEEPLKAHGPTARLNVPLDRLHFVPGPRGRHERPRVGTSGFVYPAGRKGGRCWARWPRAAATWNSPPSARLASPTPHVTWEDVPAFYRSLDVTLHQHD
jgi:hypothetical protein